jgi:hypothetical protein
MAFQEVAGRNTYRPYEKLSVGEVVAEGWYEGKIKGTYGENHLVREANGEVIEVNKCGHLDGKMTKAGILVGDYIQIVYDGQDKMERGPFKGKLAHNVKLYRDPSRNLRVGATAAEQAAAAAKKPNFKPEASEDTEARAERVKDFAASLDDDDGEMDL